MDRAAYDRYLGLFNQRQYDAILDHFADSFELVFAGYVFRNRAEVIRFYTFFHAHVTETVTVHHFLSGPDMVALEADVRVEAYRDMTAATLEAQGLARIPPLQQGQVLVMPQFIHYHLRDGKIIRALCAVFEPPHL
jgi:hypothetical protein